MTTKINIQLSIICFILLFTNAYSYKFQYRLLADVNSPVSVLDKDIYVQQDSQHSYFYKVYSDNGKIQIHILDQDLKTYDLEFDKLPNQLVFRDAYYNYIIVEEKNSTGNSIQYWVIEINQVSDGYVLNSFAVNSTVDNEQFALQDDYTLKNIVEYNRVQERLYIMLQTGPHGNSSGDSDMYAIDLKNKGNTLIAIGWFYFNKTQIQNIVGGNSRVQVDAAHDQFLIDTENKRANDSDQTIYDRVNISSLTSYTIYPGGSRAYNLLGSWFQYASVSEDGKNMTTFLYHGYGKEPIQAEASINSTQKPIKFFYDQATYFIAVGDNDIYGTFLTTWDETKNQYTVFSTNLKDFASDPVEQQKLIENFYSAILMIYDYHDDVVYFISQDKFFAYSQTVAYEKDLDTKVTADTNLQQVLFKQIGIYESSTKTGSGQILVNKN